MPIGLTIPFKKEMLFRELLEEVRRVLEKMLNCQTIPLFEIQTPPAQKHPALENSELRNHFGAYVALSAKEGSMVDIVVFESRGRKVLGCSSAGRTAISDVFTAAVAIAAARRLEGRIEDHAHHWQDRDDYSFEDLMSALAIPDNQSDLTFEVAIDLVSKKQFKVPSYGNPAPKN
jgi:hypothetical protein